MVSKKSIQTVFIFLLVAALVAACAGFSAKVRAPRVAFERGDYQLAAVELQELAEKKDNDELLYWMELGLTYHSAGQYKEAIDAFFKADKLAEIHDYTSLSHEAMSVLLNDDLKPYKGEDFEKILIHVYLAMDFALSGQSEASLVECRKVNHMLDLMISEGKLPYERNAFAKYLAGALFESGGEINNALVDYRQLEKWRGPLPFLGEPVLRISQKLGMEQEFDDYKKKFSSINAKDCKLGKNEGEVILLLEQGRVPYKVPREEFRLLPRFQRVPSNLPAGWLRDSKTGVSARTYPFFDIEEAAVKELEHKIALIMAKKVAGLAAKEVLANQVEKSSKSEFLGALTKIVLIAQDKADLRSWTFLPAKLQIARIKLPAGKRTLLFDGDSLSGAPGPTYKQWNDVEVKAGKITFLNTRVF